MPLWRVSVTDDEGVVIDTGKYECKEWEEAVGCAAADANLLGALTSTDDEPQEGGD